MADGGQMWAQMNAGPADPIRSFAAGASLAAQFQSVTQAAQAQSFRNTLDVLRLNNEKQDMDERKRIADQQLDLSRFNAETNRINALRPRATSGGGYGGGGTNGLIQLPDGSFGVDLGPSDSSTNVPHGTGVADSPPADAGAVTPPGESSDLPQMAGFYPLEGQEPTSGEGDMTTPPESQRVPQTAGLTLPIQGNNNGSNPLLPAMGGQTAPVSPTAGEIVNVNGRMVRRLPPNTTITQGPRGTTVTTRTPTAEKPKDIAPLDWDTMGKLAAFGGLELTGVDGFDTNGRPQPKFEKPKDKKTEALYDFDQLDEETRAKIMDSFKKVAFPVPPGGFTDMEKMAAVGIVLPPDADQDTIGAAGKKMTPELWTRGYNILKEKALANREQAVTEHAALLTSVAGKPVTPEQVVKMLPDYQPPADKKPGAGPLTMDRMTETGESANVAGAGTPAGPAAGATQLTADQRRELGVKAKALRQQVVDGGIDTATGLPKNKAANDELAAINDQLSGSAPAAAPAAAAPGAAPAAAPQATGPIRTYAEMQTLRKEEEQKPLKEEDAKQWQKAKSEALDLIEKAAKKSGVPAQSILASIARGGPDKHSALSLGGVWDEFKGKERYAFKRKASTPGINQVTWEEVVDSLADSTDLLQERYGITPEQLRAGGGQARRDLYK